MKALITSALIGISVAVQASAAVPQTHVYRSDNNFNVLEGDVSVSHSDVGSARLITITGADATVRLTTDKVDHIDIKTVAVPRLRIDIPSNPDMPQVQDKESYVGALVSIEGNGYIDDYPQAKVNIKGRGNSTWWMMPKKPMRLKFDKKTPFGGLAKAKSFVLLANYIDPTLMRNAVAMKIAELIEIPWANHIIPVNVTFNGADLGAFMLTEKIGINGASVDIDETEGML